MFKHLARIDAKLWCHTALVVLPLTIITTTLLGLVFDNIWNEKRAGIQGVSLDRAFASSSLYVDYSATRLILVASWSSSIALPLISSLMGITSYLVAADILWSSQKGFHVLLPTSSQLAMLTDLLDAKQSALWMWVTQLWYRDPWGLPSRWIIEFPAAIQGAGLLLSVCIIAADSWLHLQSRSATVPYLSKIQDPATMGLGYYYSRDLTDTCLSYEQNMCSVDTTSQMYPIRYADKIRDTLLAGAHSDTRINRTEENGFFLAPQLPRELGASIISSVAHQNFTAHTFTTSSSCESDITICDTSQSDSQMDSVSFNCSDGMSGEVDPSSWLRIGPWWQQKKTYADISEYYNGTDYVELGIVMFLEDVSLPDTKSYTLSSGSSSSVTGSVLSSRCYISLAAAEYVWTNVTDAPKTIPMSDPTLSQHIAAIARAPVLMDYFNSSSFDRALQDLFSSELGIAHLPDPSAISDTISSGLETATGYFSLGLLAGTYQPSPAEQLYLANSTIITQVGKAPFYALVILNIWYALFGLLLAVLATHVLSDEESVHDILAVQELLSVRGLATSAVKRQRYHLDSADLRIGVEKVNGVWQFRVFKIRGFWDEGKGLMEGEVEHFEDMKMVRAKSLGRH